MAWQFVFPNTKNVVRNYISSIFAWLFLIRDTIFVRWASRILSPCIMKVTFSYTSFIQLEFKHPVTKIYDSSFSSVVGEDIEHANKGLSQSSKGVRGQADVCFFHLYLHRQASSLDRSYRLFGVMREASATLKEDVSKVRSLRGFTENDKRLIHHLDSKEVLKVIHLLQLIPPQAETYFEQLAHSFQDGSYKHYRDMTTQVTNFIFYSTSFLLAT